MSATIKTWIVDGIARVQSLPLQRLLAGVVRSIWRGFRAS